MLANISRFSNINDYFPILNGVIITDLIVMSLLLGGVIKSKTLKLWYRKYNLNAVIADVLVIVIGIILGRFLYPYIFSSYSLVKFILLVVVLQITHDLLFYLFSLSLSRGQSQIIDTFKDYGKEVGINAILSDSGMMILSCILASIFASWSQNINIVLFIITIYLVPYFIYSV